MNSRCGHLAHLDYLIIETVAQNLREVSYHLYKRSVNFAHIQNLENFKVADQGQLPKVEN